MHGDSRERSENEANRAKMQQHHSVPRRIPLLILCGFLGSGKTTFVQHIMQTSNTLRRYSEDGKLLLFVNDLAPENVDAAAMMTVVDNGDRSGVRSALGAVAPLSNGCVCCSLLPDFLRQLMHCVVVVGGGGTSQWEYIILECSGVADAAPVAAAITQSAVLRSRIAIDAVVTILDAAHALLDTARCEGARAQEQCIWDSQLFGCNVVVLNKVDDFALRSSHSSTTGGGALDSGDGVEDAWSSLKRRVLCAARRSNPLVKLWCTNYSQLAAVDTLLVEQFLFERHEMHHLYQRHAASLLDGARKLFLTSSSPSDCGGLQDREGDIVGELMSLGALPTSAALEVERLGLTTMCVRLSLPPPSPSPPGGVSQAASSANSGRRPCLLLSRWLRSARKIYARHKITRSKGFFFAVDDVGETRRLSMSKDDDSCPTTSSTFSAETAAVVDEDGVVAMLPRKQFSWSSVEKDIQYALLLPPYISLPLQSQPSFAGVPSVQEKQDDAAHGDDDAIATVVVVEIVFIGHFEEVELQREWRAAFEASLTF